MFVIEDEFLVRLIASLLNWHDVLGFIAQLYNYNFFSMCWRSRARASYTQTMYRLKELILLFFNYV